MAQPKAETKYNEIAEAISEFQLLNRYADRDRLTGKRLGNEYKKLREARPVEGWTMLAAVYALVGDVDGVSNSLQNAQKLGPEFVGRLNFISANLTVGLRSDAQDIFIKFATPESAIYQQCSNSLYRLAYSNNDTYDRKSTKKWELN